ncbi:3-hydroxyacyl-CoA dehydrogenase family protein, partial [Candidatus Bathyarchaeota archaeon]|nr:3-hydroxyacyl-CoA dehydrogenase family protein [Candidatus Bathyarchaeota archaeon]
MEKFDRIAIIGAGVMGRGIAQVSASSGFNVVMFDIEQRILDGALEEIKRGLRRMVERGRLGEEEATAILGRVSTSLSLPEAVEGAGLVIEAVPEALELKRRVWSEVSASASSDAVFATNTSSLSITSISEAVSRPERFIGMHFFNPPTVMRLVEVIPGAHTSPETVEAVKGIAERMGKTPVIVKKDSPGFIVNRVLITYLNEAARLLERGYTKEQIDAGMQYGAGMPLGPFMLMDLIGLDIVYSILKVFEEKLGPNYRPATAIERLFRENKLGRKTSEGFYNYREAPKVSEEDGRGFNVKLLLDTLISEARKV